MVIAIYILILISSFLIFNAIATYAISSWRNWQLQQVEDVTSKLDDSFIFLEKRKIIVISFAPIILGGIGYLVLGNIWGILAGFLMGLAVPTFIARIARQRRMKQFQSQLVDTLMIFSSSLKGGLSFIQALEIVCEEMPPPVSQEFGLVLKENRLGVPLDDSLQGLQKRMPLEEVHLIVTSILVARETGGELTRVFSRLVSTIRDNIKLKEKMATLTLQGRLQGIIMAFLPIVFAIFVYRQNPAHFNIMLETEKGKMFLMIAVVLQVVGMIMIKKISTIKS
jgi:tight adherence protein B